MYSASLSHPSPDPRRHRCGRRPPAVQLLWDAPPRADHQSLLLHIILLAGILLALPVQSAPADAINATLDAGGRRTSEGNASLDASLGSLGSVTSLGNPSDVSRPGFVGQLFEVVALLVAATPGLVQQGQTAQLSGFATLDDASVLALPGSAIEWAAVTDPLVSISATGLATTANPASTNIARPRGHFLGITNSEAALLVNRPPVPSDPDAAARLANKSLKILAQKLVLNDSDPDTDALTLTAISATSANGASLRISGAWILYQPPVGFNDTDTFNYTVSDGRGGSATGQVIIIIQPDPGTLTLNVLSLETLPATNYKRIRFVGIPGRTYTIQATDSLSPAAWATLTTVTAAADGLYEFTDTDAPAHPTRFYRAFAP